MGHQCHTPIYPPGREPSTHYTGGWVGLGAGLDRCEKNCLHKGLNTGLSSPYHVTIPIELIQLPINKTAGLKLNVSARRSITLHTYIIIMLLNNWLIETCSFFKFILLHEQNMRNVELPRIILVTEFHRLAEDLLNLRIVLQIPIYFSLCH